jgi:hypothetical protein
MIISPSLVEVSRVVFALPDLRADLVLFLRLSAMCLDLKAGDATIVQWWTCGDDPQQVRLDL